MMGMIDRFTLLLVCWQDFAPVLSVGIVSKMQSPLDRGGDRS